MDISSVFTGEGRKVMPQFQVSLCKGHFLPFALNSVSCAVGYLSPPSLLLCPFVYPTLAFSYDPLFLPLSSHCNPPAWSPQLLLNALCL
jgi:hypothetical protein